MYYRLFFERDVKLAKALKIILLIAGLFCDFAALFGLIFAIFGAYFYLVLFFGSIAFGILFRVVAIKLVYNIECTLDDGKLVISKIYPNKTKQVFAENLADIKAEVCSNDSKFLNIKKYDNKEVINLLTSEKEKYLISSSTKYVLCNLDKYIYASILNGEEI